MMSRLRALERKLAPERAEIAVTDRVNEFAAHWQDALDQGRHPPDALELNYNLVRDGFLLPTMSRAFRYLESCLRDRSPPGPGRLFRTLLPWCGYPGPIGAYPAHAWT